MRAIKNCQSIGKSTKFVELYAYYFNFLCFNFFICTKNEWIRSEGLNLTEHEETL